MGLNHLSGEIFVNLVNRFPSGKPRAIDKDMKSPAFIDNALHKTVHLGSRSNIDPAMEDPFRQ